MTNGVGRYTTGTLSIHFPQGQVCCLYCPCMTRDFGLRCRCLITAELLPYPEVERGGWCPVVVDEKEEL